MYYVYALQSVGHSNWLYIGRSDDLRKRVQEHHAGKVISTSKYRPLRLVYYEAYVAKKDATKREYQLKHNCQKKEQLNKDFSSHYKHRLTSCGGTPIGSQIPYRLFSPYG
jgi:putative endonuclease